MLSTTHLDTAVPDAYKALLAVGKASGAAASAAGLDERLIDLVFIRASQLNGCAFCQRMHIRQALTHGETTDRIAVIAAWRDTEYFTAEERAALEISEQVTLIGDLQAGRRTQTLDDGVDLSVLNLEQTAAVRWLAIVINSFNRVAILSQYEVMA